MLASPTSGLITYASIRTLDPSYYYDRTLSGIYLGKSFIAGKELNADIAGVFLVDELLTNDAINAIADAMIAGVDLTDTICPFGNPCTACPAGKYKDASGSAACTNCTSGTYSQNATAATACLACPANSNSPVASTSCACNPGYALLADACVCAIGFEPIT